MNIKESNLIPTPSIGVGGVVFNSIGEVLLIQRNQAPAKGMWSVPGGKIDPGESLVETCRREIEEETGLLVYPKSIIAVVERKIENFHFIIIDYWAELLSNENQAPIPDTDVIDVGWFSVNRLSEMDVVIGLEAIIKKTHSTLQSGKFPGLSDCTDNGTDFIF